MPPKKRLPAGRRAPAVYVEEIRRIIKRNRKKIKEHSLEVRKASKSWHNKRSYNEVRLYWMSCGVDIKQLMISRAKKTRERLRIWEDGPGEGYFGSDLKKILAAEGIRAHLVATTLSLNEIQADKRSSFDEVRVGKSELFIPRNPFDFIFTTMASVNYTHRILRRSNLLKMAYSLKHGGHLLVVFMHIPSSGYDDSLLESSAVVGSLLQRPPQGREIRLADQMKLIIRAFAKRGFTAKFEQMHGMELDSGSLHVVRN